jgi:DNA polymerase-1
LSPKKQTAKPHSLQSLARRELGSELDKEHQKADWGGELSSSMLEYAAKDAQILLPLAKILGAKIEDSCLERVSEIEHRALPAMVWMANAGVPFDEEGWKAYLEQVVEIELVRGIEKLNQLAPEHPEGKIWNWNSHLQVKEAFRLVGVILPNIRKETLECYEHPLAQALLEYKKASTLLSNYGPSLLEKVEDGRIYASWHQIGAATGRISCSKPPLQQIPREVLRHYVRAPEGRLLVSADYSQAELRIAARITGDKRMLEAYSNGEDLHATTARILMGREQISKEERDLAKAVNFGLLYGQGAEGLREYARNNYRIRMTTEEARRYRRRFFDTYPSLKAWHEAEWRRLRQGNTETRTLTGRRRSGVRNFTSRVNAPVQGTGADGLKLALALLYESRDECPGAHLVSCVHDEMVVECDENNVEKVKAWLEKARVDGMSEVVNFPEARGPYVPIKVKVKIGRTWAG